MYNPFNIYTFFGIGVPMSISFFPNTNHPLALCNALLTLTLAILYVSFELPGGGRHSASFLTTVEGASSVKHMAFIIIIIIFFFFFFFSTLALDAF
jgi:hypothetical protein